MSLHNTSTLRNLSHITTYQPQLSSKTAFRMPQLRQWENEEDDEGWRLRAERTEQELQTTKDLLNAMTTAKEEVDRSLSASSQICSTGRLFFLIECWAILLTNGLQSAMILATSARSSRSRLNWRLSILSPRERLRVGLRCFPYHQCRPGETNNVSSMLCNFGMHLYIPRKADLVTRTCMDLLKDYAKLIRIPPASVLPY